MSDEPIDDYGGGLDPDSEPNPEPEDSEPIQSSWSDFLVGQHKTEDGEDLDDAGSIYIDPLLEARLNEVLGDDHINPQSLFVHIDDVDDFSNVRGTAHATQLSALNYILEGGIQGFSFIVYDPEDDAYYVWVDYEE